MFAGKAGSAEIEILEYPACPGAAPLPEWTVGWKRRKGTRRKPATVTRSRCSDETCEQAPPQELWPKVTGKTPGNGSNRAASVAVRKGGRPSATPRRNRVRPKRSAANGSLPGW